MVESMVDKKMIGGLIAGIHTKPLDRATFWKHLAWLGIAPVEAEAGECG